MTTKPGITNDQARGGTRALSSSLRTLAMLDTIAGFNRPVRFAELARAIGGSRASNYQKLVTLVEAGWVEGTPEGAYRLTLHAARIGSVAFNQAGLGKRMHPIMEALSAELGESVSLAVLDNDVLYIIEEVMTQDLLRVSYRVGTTMKIENTASGRVFAAFVSPEHRAKLVAQGIALPDAQTLERVRGAFFATSHRGEKAEILAVGAPVFDAQQRIIAVLSIAGPYDRIDVERSRLALMRAVSRFMNESGGFKPWGDAYG
ncbi:IclR family transcriptional regulator [Aquibium sp. A9E412]|uniref:IclR family transcriptional regulator n=1 Tax=Aquibium sp. A9E412 TaxID=2976767 RepID=UPI0025B1A52A|nr:IclR family transcriptional regulator [Aquibium sp. A9E412]MDN2565062.1 IclR family transcriptional regulator [Aquibium sp. A9E412]